MQLLILAPAFFPAIGGAEVYARTVAQGMAARGHSVTVLTADNDGSPSYEREAGFDVVRCSGHRALLDDPTKLVWEQMAFGVLPDIEHHLNSTKQSPDIVFANSMDTAIAGSIVGRALHRPVVANYHEVQAEFGPLGPGRLRFAYGDLPLQALIAVSSVYLKRAVRYGIQRERLHYIPLAADSAKFYPPDVRPGRDASEFRVLLSGRFTPRKQQTFAVDLASRLRSRGIPIRLTLAGASHSTTPSYLHAIQHEIAERNAHSYVDIVSDVDHDRMPELYWKTDVVIQPSSSEGLGLALVEAMMCRVPVVAADTQGITDLITDDRLGVLLPYGDLDAWTQSLEFLWRSPGVRERLASEGHRHVLHRHELQRMLDGTESLLVHVCGSWGRVEGEES